MALRLTHRIATLVAVCALPPLAFASPAAAEQPAGTVVSTTAVTGVRIVDGADTARKVTYWTTNRAGRPVLSTGALYVPPGDPPPGGWPVVAWAHGTFGIADQCAPSGKDITDRDNNYLAAWVRQGYAVVATDYAGLGTPQLHHYLDGVEAAHSVIDMVRAARAAAPSLSDTWVVVGQSQGGHAALFTAAEATSYAPELDYRGAVVTGAPTNLELLLTLTAPVFPPVPISSSTTFVAMILAAVRGTHPELDVDSYLTETGKHAVEVAQSQCFPEASAQLAATPISALLAKPLSTPEFAAALRETLAVPVAGYDRPLFVAHGLADTTVPVPLALKFAGDLVANGVRFDFRTYPTSHSDTMQASLPDSLPFVAAALR